MTIDVTKESTLEERKKYIHALQVHYGLIQTFNLDSLEGKYAAEPPIFRTIPDGQWNVPENYKHVSGLRDFVVVATLPQFAHRGSHRLELYLDKVYVGDVSVFSRLEPEKCENCVGRLAIGTPIVRGVITLPPAVVLQVLQKNRMNHARTSEGDIVEVLHQNLVSRIVRPNNSVIAHAEYGFVTGPGLPSDDTDWFNFTPPARDQPRFLATNPVAIRGQRYPPLEEKHQPTLELHSAALYVGDQAPPARVDWKHHSTVLRGEWRRWTPSH